MHLDRKIASHILEEFSSSAIAPWKLVSSRELSRRLGVSVQALANWRIRGCGPASIGLQRGHGNRIFYRRSAVIAWLAALNGQGQEEWAYSRDWLVRFGIATESATRAEVEWAEQALHDL